MLRGEVPRDPISQIAYSSGLWSEKSSDEPRSPLYWPAECTYPRLHASILPFLQQIQSVPTSCGIPHLQRSLPSSGQRPTRGRAVLLETCSFVS